MARAQEAFQEWRVDLSVQRHRAIRWELDPASGTAVWREPCRRRQLLCGSQLAGILRRGCLPQHVEEGSGGRHHYRLYRAYCCFWRSTELVGGSGRRLNNVYAQGQDLGETPLDLGVRRCSRGVWRECLLGVSGQREGEILRRRALSRIPLVQPRDSGTVDWSSFPVHRWSILWLQR